MICDIYTVLPFLVCLFWTVQMLLGWRRNSAAQHVLTLFMGVSTVLYLCHYIFFNYSGPTALAADCIYTFCNLAVFPLYYVYICRLTSTRRTTTRQWMLLAPAVLMCLWTVIQFATIPHCSVCESVRANTAKVVFAVEAVAVVIMGNHRLLDFDAKLNEYYSNTYDRSVKQTRIMMIVLLIGVVASLIALSIGREYFNDNPMLLAIPSLAFTILLFAVGYVGMVQRFCADDLARENGTEPAERCVCADVNDYDTAPKDNNNDAVVDHGSSNENELLSRLNTMMAEEKLYLQPDLRLIDLAQSLKVGRTMLSNAINQHGGVTFSDYVNQMRVSHAKMLIDNNESGLTIIEIAERSGFTNENSFYRAFRRLTGMTPGQWAKRARHP